MLAAWSCHLRLLQVLLVDFAQVTACLTYSTMYDLFVQTGPSTLLSDTSSILRR